MAANAAVKAPQKKKFTVPHILILIFIIAMVACLASYIAPVGVFDLDDKGNAIAGTYHAVERSAVSPIHAMLWVKRGIENASSIISLMLIGGGSIACVVATGAFDDILNYGVYKPQDKSVSVLVPAIVVLMSLLGSFAGTAIIKMLLHLGVRNIISCDEYGILYKERAEGIRDHKKELCEVTNKEGLRGTLADALKGADVFIGVSVGAVSSRR